MSGRGDLVTAVLREPARVGAFGPADWERLLRQAKRSNTLGRVGVRLAEAGLEGGLPEQVRPHFTGVGRLGARHAVAVRWEARCLTRALAALDAPVVFLKGAAYLLAGLPAAEGRLFGDIDILVPRAKLAAAEDALLGAGWFATHHDAYDQRYYREWMHEIPPLRHVARQTTVDVHHTILPPTAGRRLDPARLFEAARPLPGLAQAFVLAPADMVLHSATHLFYEGEFPNGLRDLSDLDALLRHFAGQPAFWETLAGRALELDLARPLHYALRYTGLLLGTPLPPSLVARLAPQGPGAWRQGVMDALFTRALRPLHPSCDDALGPFARWLLYLRAHRLRMPLRLLLPHLARKALRRLEGG